MIFGYPCAPRTRPRRSRSPGHSQSKSLSMFITPNGIRAFIIRHWFCARGSVRENFPASKLALRSFYVHYPQSHWGTYFPPPVLPLPVVWQITSSLSSHLVPRHQSSARGVPDKARVMGCSCTNSQSKYSSIVPTCSRVFAFIHFTFQHAR